MQVNMSANNQTIGAPNHQNLIDMISFNSLQDQHKVVKSLSFVQEQNEYLPNTQQFTNNNKSLHERSENYDNNGDYKLKDDNKQ